MSSNLYSPRSRDVSKQLHFLCLVETSKSQLSSRSFFICFLCFMCLIYSTNSYEFFMYIIKLNRIVLRNLLSITLQQVFLFVNIKKRYILNINLKKIQRYMYLCIFVSLYLCILVSLYPCIFVSL
uniref:Transmembrane protein n=1 Tax=Bacillus thuringiensis TaxID=1428 RepID=Q9X6Z9_BACTU|nr:hypothetical protein [Bacillus thuringiensis serovar kurstaki]